ncbi:hypothetical protein ZWY2020_014026 [Hordeum vulgare]|nr:hypothetical protein ZWY2020_014026 [Hordeum vulgare]
MNAARGGVDRGAGPEPAAGFPKLKLAARGGRLEIQEEQAGVVPNGTEFVIAIRDSPELDASALVGGPRRLAGAWMPLQSAGSPPSPPVKDNTSSAYLPSQVLQKPSIDRS